MAELKTKETKESALDFVKSLEDEIVKKDCLQLIKIFKEATGEKPRMWGTAIIGFGKYHYKSERSKQEGDWLISGFSPRKQNLTLYIMLGLKEKDLLNNLGKHKTSVGCLYIKKLSDVDLNLLKQLIQKNHLEMKKRFAV